MLSLSVLLEKLIYFFTIYSFLGWFLETVYVSLLEKKFVGRGFLYGPFCPIYGFGSLALILFVFTYENNLLLLFITSVIVTSILEYITSFFLEKLFHTTWWNYSKEPFNINGRVCLKNSLYWGILSVFILTQIHPIINQITIFFQNIFGHIGPIIIALYFLTDLIFTLRSLFNLKKVLKNNLPFDYLNKQTLRLIKAFPNLKSLRHPEIIDKFKKIISDLQK